MPIQFEKLGHIYGEGTPFRFVALKDVSLDIEVGKMTAIIGQTGSGKSTLVQHLNALLLPTSGEVHILDRTIKAGENPKKLKSLRGRVGLVFQFPEYQLFEETVLKDIAFGPKNFGVPEDEAAVRARKALKEVGLDESYEERSPLELSGGQKRRVAIAGILAMDPEVLVLDEPTAGLDPEGAEEIMKLFSDLNHNQKKTIITVTHDMELVYQYFDNVVVMEKGSVRAHMSVREFFSNSSEVRRMNILPPAIIRLRDALQEKGMEIPSNAIDMESLADAIVRQVKKHG